MAVIGTKGSGVEVSRRGGLSDRVASLLASGPLPTDELAEQVLAVRGNPRSAASAVFALLGDDGRFRVDGQGIWSLRPESISQAPSLLEEEWVVVDVETTGGSPERGHRITEVAAVWVSGTEIRETYSTLVNPDRSIPGMITSLTGITNAMVADAPRFREIAPRLTDALRGKVFVAHNASFDWRFVCAEMERSTGQVLTGRQLCTVRLARKLMPELSSRSLDALALYFGLEIASRHRALDDAVATAQLLARLFDLLADRGIQDWSAVDALLRKRAPRRNRAFRPRSMDSA